LHVRRRKNGLPSTRCQDRLRADKGAIQTLQKPSEPFGDVEVALLCSLQRLVIGLPLDADLRRHAVEAPRRCLRAGQRHIGNGACDASVSIFERVDRDEPEVSQGSEDHRIDAAARIEPIEKAEHFGRKPFRGRCFEVNVLAADRPGDDLHRS
jgi:hypothetical protein